MIIYWCPNIMFYFQEYINEPLLHWKMVVRWIPINRSNVIFWRTVTLMGSLASSSPLELETSSLNQLWKPYWKVEKGLENSQVWSLVSLQNMRSKLLSIKSLKNVTVCFFRCASISWYQVVTKSVSEQFSVFLNIQWIQW